MSLGTGTVERCESRATSAVLDVQTGLVMCVSAVFDVHVQCRDETRVGLDNVCYELAYDSRGAVS